jgi:hypothetical protein
LFGLLAAAFVLLIVIKNKIEVVKLVLFAVLFALAPLASNFASIFDTEPAYGLMMYSYVFLLVFFIVISELCKSVYPLIRAVFVVIALLIIGNYISGNNTYYMRAHYSNQRTYSLTVRVLDKIESLLPLTSANVVTVYGGLPNEYHPQVEKFPAINDGSAVTNSVFLNYNMIEPLSFSISVFGGNISNNHGIKLSMLTANDEKWYEIREKVLATNMPVWPAEGGIGIIDDVIVVNFGIADVVWATDDNGAFFTARHWVSEGHASHIYEYQWTIYQNGKQIGSFVTAADRLDFDLPNADDHYLVTVKITNVTEGYSYPLASLEIGAGG